MKIEFIVILSKVHGIVRTKEAISGFRLHWQIIQYKRLEFKKIKFHVVSDHELLKLCDCFFLRNNVDHSLILG